MTTLADAGPGSLRDAIASTPAGGIVDFQPGLTGTITLTSDTLTIDHSLTISGPGAKSLAVSGNQQFRVFYVTSGATVSISSLSIIHGQVTGSSGGGGGIANAGTLTVTGCVLSGNSVLSNSNDGRFPGIATGGAIGSDGTLTIIASTLSSNSAVNSVGSLAEGGGISNTAGTLTVINSTLSGNTASTDSIGGGLGGAIASYGKLTVINSTYTGGVAVAIGDVNGDGFPDLVTAPTAGNPHVKVYDGKAIANGTFNSANPDASLLTSFFAYGLNFNVGANVAVGDVSGNGFADIVTGATAGNPQVKVYDGQAIAHHTFNPAHPDASLLASFFAYGLNFNVGANVAVGDISGNGFADLVTGATGGNPQVKVYDGQAIAHHTFNGANPDASLLTAFFAFGLNFNVGAFVTVGDVTGNGFGDVIVGATVGNPQVKVYDGQAIAKGTFNGGNPDASVLASFFAYGLNFNIGASVCAANFDVGGPAEILTGAAQGSPHYRVVKGLSSGVQPPADHGIDTVATDLTGGALVGA